KPIVTGLNAVVDRRCGPLADHCPGGTLGVLAQCEPRSSGIHRVLLLKTTTHTLRSAAQSTRLCGLSLCHCVVNIGALCDRRAFRAVRDLQHHEVIYLIVLGFAAAGNWAMLFFCEQTSRHVLGAPLFLLLFFLVLEAARRIPRLRCALDVG